MEYRLVQRRGISFQHVPSAGFHGVGLRSLPGNFLRMGQGYLAARRTLQAYQPDAILLTGGFPGIPIALARGRTPLMLYVPDIEPGSAARMIGRWASRVAVTSRDSLQYYPDPERMLVSGYPIRPWLSQVSKDQACSNFDLDVKESVVLVFGGSRGARSINHAVWEGLPTLLEHTQLIHITGVLDWRQVDTEREQLDAELRSRYRPHAYLHDEMGFALSAADLAVSRAGAAVLGEYACYALPSILVPYPHGWRYQTVNADYLVERGAAIRIDDSSLRADLAPQVIALLSDPARLARMSSAASKLAVPNAAETIAEELLRLAGSGNSAMSAGPAGGNDRQPPGETRQPSG